MSYKFVVMQHSFGFQKQNIPHIYIPAHFSNWCRHLNEKGDGVKQVLLAQTPRLSQMMLSCKCFPHGNIMPTKKITQLNFLCIIYLIFVTHKLTKMYNFSSIWAWCDRMVVGFTKHRKLKRLATRTPPYTGGELRSSRKVSSSCLLLDPHHVNHELRHVLCLPF